MKNFSTVGPILALTAAFATTHADSALAAGGRCSFKPNAPDQHLVVKGDTLWGISGKFLDHAWCWPEVWGLNKEEIANPHWIYPGQTVYFDRAAGRLRLGKGAAGSGGDNRGPNGPLGLQPQIRTSPLGEDAITSIPSGVIEPFLSQPLIVEPEALSGAARVVAAPEGRVLMGEGDRAYVRGNLKDGTSFQVFRPNNELKDPDTQKVIGYEAVYLGTMTLDQVARNGSDVHTFVVGSFKQEIGVGDRLLPVPPSPILNYVPHPPNQKVTARVVSIYGGVVHGGQNQIVAINRGKQDGLDLGAVLELSRYGEVVEDKTAPRKWNQIGKEKIKLPNYQYGTAFVFRTFNRISYALVMQVQDVVKVGDLAASPE